MKKKIITMCLVVALAATAIVGGTLAYFTDTDADQNTFTVGNVKIVQNEEQRPVDENGKYKDGDVIGFIDETSALVPAVVPDGSKNGSYDGTVKVADEKEYKIWDKSINNELDKFISVTNVGTEEAYVRTIIAFEDNEAGTITPYLHTLWGFNGDGSYVEKTANPDAFGKYTNLPNADVVWLMDNNGEYLTIGLPQVNAKNETVYVPHSIAVITYTEKLAAKATTVPSLMQLWLDQSATNEWSKAVGDKYTIYAASLAVQADGFDTASKAMDTAFDLTVENMQKWLTATAKTDNYDNTVAGAKTYTE